MGQLGSVHEGLTGQIAITESGIRAFAGLAPDLFAGDAAALCIFRNAGGRPCARRFMLDTRGMRMLRDGHRIVAICHSPAHEPKSSKSSGPGDSMPAAVSSFSPLARS
jgi:hypothetical protein